MKVCGGTTRIWLREKWGWKEGIRGRGEVVERMALKGIDKNG